MSSDKSYSTEQRLNALINWTASFPLVPVAQSSFTSEVIVGYFGPVPANDPVANVGGGMNGGYRIRCKGFAGFPAAQVVTVNLRVAPANNSLSGSSVFASPIAVAVGAAAVARGWAYDAWLYYDTVGASGRLRSGGVFLEAMAAAVNPGTGSLGATHAVGDSGITVSNDTTAPWYVLVTMQMNNASASNAGSTSVGSMERIGRW